MDFQSVNHLNMQMNLISGNLFPMSDNSRFPIRWKIYSAIVWSVCLVVISGFFVGFLQVSKRKAISDGMIGTVFVIEVIFVILRIHINRNLVEQLIRNINNILRVQNETMKSVVTSALKLMNSPFKFYWLTGMTTATIWIIVPITNIFKKGLFVFEDYRLPFAISKQPFSKEIFLLGSILLSLGSIYIIIKKNAADIYTLNFVMLMTAQYHYIAITLKEIFREKNLQNEYNNDIKKDYSDTNLWAEREMKAICQHHSTVVHMSYMLKKLLSLNFSLLYVNNILRFSFVGVMISNTSLLKTIVERIAIIFFAVGEMIQFYILCYNVQKLLDASTKITDMAFHENWYQYRPSIKRNFILVILSNNLKCKLASLEKFNVSLPSFMTIMNQAYSITLLCLKIVKK